MQVRMCQSAMAQLPAGALHLVPAHDPLAIHAWHAACTTPARYRPCPNSPHSLPINKRAPVLLLMGSSGVTLHLQTWSSAKGTLPPRLQCTAAPLLPAGALPGVVPHCSCQPCVLPVHGMPVLTYALHARAP
jgi:hypothetical protein